MKPDRSGRMPLILQLFLTFAKIGLFTLGGGYAMISIIENNCVERNKWISHDEMMNITVILAAAAFLSGPVLKKKISPVLLIVISAFLGIAFYGI